MAGRLITRRCWRLCWWLGGAAGIVAGTVIVAGASAAPAADRGGATSTTAPPNGAQNWTVYHYTPGGTGVVSTPQRLLPAHEAWTSPVLDGALFGEPLVLNGVVYVATENNTVYALNGRSGSVIWSRHLAAPVPSSMLPCGDITPTVGITGTPVIDPSRKELFAVANELVAGQPAHMLVGLDTSTGQVMLNQAVDPPGSDTASLLQRTGLTLDNGQVIFGYGGNFEDCGSYHGWVASVPERGGPNKFFEVDSGPGERQGAIWMGGAAPVIDASGNVWVAAGNGSVTSPSAGYDNSDSVLELSPSLQLLQYFAPSNWASDNASDFDLGSSAPALMPNGLVVQGGKSHTVYLLNKAHLGGIGGQLTRQPFCSTDQISGGAAITGTTVFLPCRTGVGAFRVGTSPPSLTQLWQTSTGAGGPPIFVGGQLWSISQSGTLYALLPGSGTAAQSFSLGSEANHFPSPSFGAGLLLAPAADQVYAFAGSAAPSKVTPPTAKRPPVTSTTRRSTTSGGRSPTTTSGGRSPTTTSRRSTATTAAPTTTTKPSTTTAPPSTTTAPPSTTTAPASTTTAPPSTTTSTTTKAASALPSEGSSSSGPPWLGIGIASALGVAAIGSASWWLYSRRRAP